jgi:hypothetical protein
MKLKRMKQHLRGAFTVDAPRKRLRAWTGIPIAFGFDFLGLIYPTPKAKDMASKGSTWGAAAVLEIPRLVVGGALMAHPYTRWAGVTCLAFGLAGMVATATWAIPQKQSIFAGALAGPVRILRG